MTEQPAHIVNDEAVTRYARRYAEANMTATVRITRMDEPFLNSSGDLIPEEMFTIYEGKGRVYSVSGPMTMNLGEEPQYYSSTYISIPLSATLPRVDDVVEVLTHRDWTMPGRKFRVMDVEAGGQYPAARRMQVTGIQRSKQWGTSEPVHPAKELVIPEEWRV